MRAREVGEVIGVVKDRDVGDKTEVGEVREV